MKQSELTKYLLQALNMALQILGETSYTNSFDVKVSDEGFSSSLAFLRAML